MEFDVVIVGAGPAGLAAAIRLKQLDANLSVVVLEKGSEVGAHIRSSTDRSRPVDPRVAHRPGNASQNAGLQGPVSRLDGHRGHGPAELADAARSRQSRQFRRLSWEIARWLAKCAELLGVEIYPGFAAGEALFGADGEMVGVATGDMGVGRDGRPKSNFTRGMRCAANTPFSRRARRSLTKRIVERFKLDEGRDPQKFEIGLKELWQIDRQVVSGRPDATHPQPAAHGWREWTLVSLLLRRQPGLERWGCSAGPAMRFSTATRWRPSWQGCWGYRATKTSPRTMRPTPFGNTLKFFLEPSLRIGVAAVRGRPEVG